jgi:hypothetical protein
VTLAELRALTGGTGTALTARQVGFDARTVLVTSTGWNQGGRTPVRIEAVITRGTNTSGPVTTVTSRKQR